MTSGWTTWTTSCCTGPWRAQPCREGTQRERPGSGREDADRVSAIEKSRVRLVQILLKRKNCSFFHFKNLWNNLWETDLFSFQPTTLKGRCSPSTTAASTPPTTKATSSRPGTRWRTWWTQGRPGPSDSQTST